MKNKKVEFIITPGVIQEVKEEIQEAFGPDIKVVDSVDGVVKHALQVVDIDFFKQPVIPVVIMTDKNDL